jgi:hypothetical protein
MGYFNKQVKSFLVLFNYLACNSLLSSYLLIQEHIPSSIGMPGVSTGDYSLLMGLDFPYLVCRLMIERHFGFVCRGECADVS